MTSRDSNVTPEQALEIANAIIDRDPDVSSALEVRLEVMTRRARALTAECDQLIAQLVNEGARAANAEAQLEAAKTLIRGSLDVNHGKHWRERARKWLGELELIR